MEKLAVDDLFSPPTKDELDQLGQKNADPIFAPLSNEEKAQLGQKAGSFVDNHRGIIKGTLNSLPTIGSYGGGMLGGAAGLPTAGPAGAVAGGFVGSAVGGGIGNQLKQLGEQYILGEDKQAGDYVSGAAKGVEHGLEQEVYGQGITKAVKFIGDAPSLLRELAEGPAQQAAKNTNLVRDPFFKVVHPKGLSMSEVDEGLQAGRFGNEMPSADPTLGQKAAQYAVRGGEALASGAKTAGKVIQKVGPIAAKLGGAVIGHFPGYATAEVLTSPAGKEITIGAAKIIKDTAGNILTNPEGAGLLMNATRQIKQNEEQ